MLSAYYSYLFLDGTSLPLMSWGLYLLMFLPCGRYGIPMELTILVLRYLRLLPHSNFYFHYRSWFYCQVPSFITVCLSEIENVLLSFTTTFYHTTCDHLLQGYYLQSGLRRHIFEPSKSFTFYRLSDSLEDKFIDYHSPECLVPAMSSTYSPNYLKSHWLVLCIQALPSL